MKKGILLTAIYFGVIFCLSAQTNVNDTIVVKSVESIPIDSVNFNSDKDTTINIFQEDSLNTVQKDSIGIRSDSISSIASSDTVFRIESDSLMHNNAMLSYDRFVTQFEDSSRFSKVDSSHYLLHKIQDFIKSDTLYMEDSLKQAIQLLAWFYKSKNIKPVLAYLENQIETSKKIANDTIINSDTLYVKDSIHTSVKDSILSSVEYILASLPEDSVKLFVVNSKGDTVIFNNALSEKDSSRINIYDKRNEYGVLWLKKSQGANLHLKLEDGIYIDKPKQRKTVEQEIDTYYEIPGLKKMKKVNIIIPFWEYYSTADIRFNQGYLENWAEGGENSMSALGIFKFGLSYSYGKLRNWENTLEYRLGYLKAGENPIQKNDDKLEFNSKYGRTAFKDWYYSVLLNFKTQILKGYDYPNDSIAISEFMSPAYLVFSLGLDYKPSKKLTVLISPITSKFTIVADTVNYDQTRYGVGEDEYVRKEIGAYVKAISKLKLSKKIELINKLNFFTNYVDKPENIDIDWEADLAIKLSNNIKVAINAHIIYDDDVSINDEGPKLQFKESLGVGFIYKF